MKVYIEPDALYFQEVNYTFSVFSQYCKLEYTLVSSSGEADLVISGSTGSGIRIKKDFYEKIQSGRCAQDEFLDRNGNVVHESGAVDYLSTAFYMLALIQELSNENVDEFGRFKFEDTYQCKNNSAEENLVAGVFDAFRKEINGLVAPAPEKSRIFLSHDIDTINGSIIQDLFYCLRKLDIRNCINIILKNVLSKPYWFNMDRIMKIESDYDLYSTFYWLVRRGAVDGRLKNSDYNIHSQRVTDMVRKIEGTGKWENGLHKSAAPSGFKEELNELGIGVIGNRFHYLKFNPHVDFARIEEAGLKFDSSLGFANAIGFRNSYGLPYKPYNLKERRSYNFVECPLHVMDTTFHFYKRLSGAEFAASAISFIEKHNSDCVLSLLFHNNYFSEFKYGEYFKGIKTIMEYLYNNSYKPISQSEIVNKYGDEYCN